MDKILIEKNKSQSQNHDEKRKGKKDEKKKKKEEKGKKKTQREERCGKTTYALIAAFENALGRESSAAERFRGVEKESVGALLDTMGTA